MSIGISLAQRWGHFLLTRREIFFFFFDNAGFDIDDSPEHIIIIIKVYLL